MKLLQLIIIITFGYLSISVNAETIVSLNGKEWTVTNANKSIKVLSQIPGSIFTDLRRDGILKEDPYFGSNDMHYRWVGRDNWTFERSFQIESSILNKKGVFLVCHGIDTVSQIYLNDALIGTTDNMFVRYKFDIKNHLKVGTNHIKVAIESAVTYGKRKSEEYIKEKHYSVPPDNQYKNSESHVNFVRKMQSSFGWDWGPSFPTQGIWKNIEIEALDTAVIRDLTVETELEKSLEWSLNTHIFLDTANNEKFEGKLEIHLQNETIFSKDMTFIPENATIKLSIKSSIPNTIKINQWWPNEVSHGTRTLYNLTVHLIPKNIKEDSRKSIKIGFRSIQVIQDRVEPEGLTMYLKVNGVKFFAKGTNWIPAHVFQEELTEEYIRHLLQSVKDAHMNMMRVWGGGIYESDRFYEIADEMGIMIWHDFMFACALYPTDEHFMNSVSTEITQQIRRLQHHPSIAVWSGNNENEWAVSAPWWHQVKQNRSVYYHDYVLLTENTTYAIIKKEDTTRSFVPSSPTNGLESEKEHFIAKNPGDKRYGDAHYYYYGPHGWDWKIFPNARFVSEYGVQSYPSLESWTHAIQPSDMTYPISAAVEHRQHHPGGTKQLEALIGNYMKLPSHGGAERFKDLIYLSQIAQSMLVKIETEFYRRNRDINKKTGEGFTMGALFWQINDIWQCPSWASIEFGGKWKMLQYYAKHMFNNLLVSPYEDSGEILKVSIVRDDLLGPLSFVLNVRVLKWSSLTPAKSFNVTVDTHSFTSHIAYEHLVPELLKSSNCSNRNECLIFVEITNHKHNLRANNFLLLTPLKTTIGLTKPHLVISNVTGPFNFHNSMHEYDIKLETNVVTPYVWIDLKDQSNIWGKFSDNGLVMVEKSMTVKFYSKTAVTSDELKSKLILKSLTDVQ